MTSPGGRIEIRVDPDLRGFGTRLATGLTDSARTGVAAFASAAKTALLGAAVGIGVAGVVAARSTLNIGVEYEGQLNTLRAVSSATEAQMQSVGRTAKALGSDLTLPATSAADAAAVMTELAKASFTVDQAQQAARGSLQLAAAAQIDGAQAATIQANAINAFGLAAGDATRVADVLANAANASSAEITDVADALAQASAVAASANISIEDTAAVIGILANNGIRGSDAGTLLKSALLALQSPSKQARDAMGDLGLTAYDAQGNFVGLQSIFEQLQVAQGRLTQEQYEMATSTLFGSDAARLAGIAAREGGEGFDEMAGAIGRQGAAAEVAAAKSRGLGGAIEAFKSQIETVQIDVFERAAPSLERLVRAAAARLPEVAASALDTADDVVETFQELSPRIGRALDARREAVTAAWQQLGQPLIEGARDLAEKGLDVVVESAERLGELAGDAVDTVEPLADAVGDLASSLAEAGGPLDTVGDGLELVADGAGLALDILGPFVRVASDLVGVVSDLPGPLQTAALGLVAFRLMGSRAGDWATTGLTGRMVNPFMSFGQTVRMQMALADDSITRSEAFRGGLATAVERQAPRISGAWREIGGAYRGGVAEASTAWTKHGLAVDGFATRVQGLSRAAQTAGSVGVAGLRSAGAGLAGFLGGPWGVALLAGGAFVSGLASEMGKAEDQTKSWADALVAGGAAAANARRQYEEQRSQYADTWFGDLTASANEWVGFDATLADAKKSADDYINSLGPMEEAQARVGYWTSELAYRLDKYGAGSEEVAAATRRHAYWSQVLADRQNGLATATQTATSRLLEQTQATLSAANTDLARREQQNQLQQAIQSTTETLASSTATDMEKQAALLALEGQITATAESERQHAIATSTSKDVEVTAMAGDAAYLAQLMATAQQLGVNTPAAISQTIAALQGTVDKGALAAAQFNQLGLEIQEVPNSKTVIVSSTTPEQIKLLESLGFKVTTLPEGRVEVTAETAAAEDALEQLARDRNATIRVGYLVTNRPPPGTTAGGVFAASGGYIAGPGTGTSDSIRAWLSNGEYVIQAAMTARSRPGLDAANRGDWAGAAAVFSKLAERQSHGALAALAATRAAGAAGRFAAGGYVDAMDRVAGPQVLPVPQRITNIRNNLYAAPQLPAIDQLNRMQRKSERMAGLR